MALDRRFLSDPAVRATRQERRYLVDSCPAHSRAPRPKHGHSAPLAASYFLPFVKSSKRLSNSAIFALSLHRLRNSTPSNPVRWHKFRCASRQSRSSIRIGKCRTRRPVAQRTASAIAAELPMAQHADALQTLRQVVVDLVDHYDLARRNVGVSRDQVLGQVWADDPGITRVSHRLFVQRHVNPADEAADILRPGQHWVDDRASKAGPAGGAGRSGPATERHSKRRINRRNGCILSARRSSPRLAAPRSDVPAPR